MPWDSVSRLIKDKTSGRIFLFFSALNALQYFETDLCEMFIATTSIANAYTWENHSDKQQASFNYKITCFTQP